MFLNVSKWSVGCLLLPLFIAAFLAVPIFVYAQNQPEREVVVLAINDVYRNKGVEDGQRSPMRASPPAAFSYNESSSNVAKWFIL